MNTTVIIPVGPGHEDLAQRAYASVTGQTIGCSAVLQYDTEGNGAGWARNQGLSATKTQYVLFLDADDWLEPNAVEVFENTIARTPSHYIYSDWYQGKAVKQAPKCAFCITENNSIRDAHLVTALMRTTWATDINGFDEQMPAMEDTDFWLKMRYVGKREGYRIAAPLVHYAPDGWRSRQIVTGMKDGKPVYTALREQLHQQILNRYSERGHEMGCCGDKSKTNNAPTNAKRKGDVLVKALWVGNKRFQGSVTGRMYRGGNGTRLWMAVKDVKAQPKLFKVVQP